MEFPSFHLHSSLQCNVTGSLDSSELQRWATGWMIGVSSPGRGWEFTLHHRPQSGCGAQPASYSVRTGGSFPGGKEAVT